MKQPSAAILLAAFLSACGGGGGGGTAGEGATAAPAPAVNLAAATVGDFVSSSQTATYNFATQPTLNTLQRETRVTTAVSAAGVLEKTTSVFDGVEFDRGDALYAPYGNVLSEQKSGCGYSYAPADFGPPNKLAPGTQWDNATTSTRLCSGISLVDKSTNKGAVAAVETITVAAGTFTAYKLVYVKVTTSPTYTLTNNYTSWRDTVSNIELKTLADRTLVHLPGKPGNNYVGNAAYELLGFAHAKSARQQLNVARFAGPWGGSYKGSYAGNCSGQVSATGALDAACGGGLFSVHGQVDAAGKVVFSLSAGAQSGPKFSGNFDTPLSISGVWTDATGASGTWVLNHL